MLLPIHIAINIANCKQLVAFSNTRDLRSFGGAQGKVAVEMAQIGEQRGLSPARRLLIALYCPFGASIFCIAPIQPFIPYDTSQQLTILGFRTKI